MNDESPLTILVKVDGVERRRPAYFEGLRLKPEIREGEQLVETVCGQQFIVTVRQP